MKRRAFALCAGLLLLVLLPGLAGATAPVLDAWHGAGNGTGVHTSNYFAQTFKALHTGTLSEVELYVACPSNTSMLAVTVERTTGSPAKPDDTDALVSMDNSKWPHNTTAAWVAFHPTHWPDGGGYRVTAGQVYAIFFTTAHSCLAYVTGNTYAAGEAWAGPGEGNWAIYKPKGDFAFRVYVVPAPKPTPTPKPTPKPITTPTPAPAATSAPTSSATASSSPSEPVASESPSATASPVSTASSVASAPADSATGGVSGSGGSPLPIIGAIIVVLAMAGGGLWFLLMRRRRPAASPPLGPTEGGSAPTAPAG